jgi:hypothetical protein
MLIFKATTPRDLAAGPPSADFRNKDERNFVSVLRGHEELALQVSELSTMSE